MNWVGPDGERIPTVPRYAVEALRRGKTWETIASFNDPEYIRAAQQAGITHPSGMCLQDAGWRFGPWLQRQPGAYTPTEYITWNQYFGLLNGKTQLPDWRVSQEDIRVSLVWGSQVLQRIAQQVRRAENRIVMAEKLATLAAIEARTPWPEAALAEGWRTLLLAQHHDCWIVPYNGRRGDTWADKVRRWTDATVTTSENTVEQSIKSLSTATGTKGTYTIRVYNSLGCARTGLVCVTLPLDWPSPAASVWDHSGRRIASQVVGTQNPKEVLFCASAPALGYRTFGLKDTPGVQAEGAKAVQLADGTVRVETDLYRVELDPKRGGTFRSLVAKRLGNRDWVDTGHERHFQEIRGFFFERQRFESSAETPAKIEIVEAGPVRVRLRITSRIAAHPVTQWVTLVQGEPRVDLEVTLNWQGNPGIGAEYRQAGGFRAEDDRKAFYDDRYKLLVLFPLNLANQTVFKDAPFDVTESRLPNTFFDTWSGIKNNVLLHWADVYDSKAGTGLALLTDHTTSYAHGQDHPLGLTLQYRGVGLWGRDYSLQGPTTVNYALLPHAGDWRAASLWKHASAWNEPLVAKVRSGTFEPGKTEQSLLTIDGGDWEVPALRIKEGKILARFFNPTADDQRKAIRCGARVSRVELVQLNGETLRELPIKQDDAGGSSFELAVPSMGIGTLRITTEAKMSLQK